MKFNVINDAAYTIKTLALNDLLVFDSRTLKKERCLQDLNLRGETPLDFKSNALTTRPKQLADKADFIKYESNSSTSNFEKFENEPS